MFRFCEELFPLCRSLTGAGVRQTLAYIKNIFPELNVHEVPSGTQAFDWVVPDEWNIQDAYVSDAKGKRLIDFNNNNLHVLGYSEPVDQWMKFSELDEHLYSLPDQPDAIPYVTSYYKRRWGFCISEIQRSELRGNPDVEYHVKIDSTLAPGNLTYGEIVLPGETEQEIFLSTYICHPSMANNELSGPAVVAALVRWLAEMPSRKYTYRMVFIPETIGSIVYLSRHHEAMKRNTIAGFVVTCAGDDRTYSYLASRKGNTLSDRVAKHVLKHHYPEYQSYSFLERGSDERQYCSPGIDLPVCSIMRTKYGEYPEYHTSLDDLNLISPQGLEGAFDVYKQCLSLLENNEYLENTVPCEPQLGSRGLYPTISSKGSGLQVRQMMNLLSYADGEMDLIEIAETIGANAIELIPLVNKLKEAGLLKIHS